MGVNVQAREGGGLVQGISVLSLFNGANPVSLYMPGAVGMKGFLSIMVTVDRLLYKYW